MQNGGYILVDCGGLDLTTGSTPVTIAGLYAGAKAAIATGKPIIAENLYYALDPLTPVQCFGWLLGDVIVMVSATIHVHISADDSVTTLDVSGRIPAAPTNLAGVAETGTITLTWTASEGATNYRVARKEAGGTYRAIATNVLETTFVDDTVEAGTTYQYAVTAQNPIGISTSAVSSAIEAV